VVEASTASREAFCWPCEDNAGFLGVEVRGDLRLPDSQIGGGFELVGTVVFGDLDMRGAEIRGEIFSSSRVEKGLQVPHEVSPIVRGQVLLTRARVRVLRLHFIAPEDGVEPPITLPTSVDLEHAEIGELIVSGQLRARKDPKFRFSGLRFDEINVDDLKAIDSGNPFVRLLHQTPPNSTKAFTCRLRNGFANGVRIKRLTTFT
jgi:hypothetical protein